MCIVRIHIQLACSSIYVRMAGLSVTKEITNEQWNRKVQRYDSMEGSPLIINTNKRVFSEGTVEI